MFLKPSLETLGVLRKVEKKLVLEIFSLSENSARISRVTLKMMFERSVSKMLPTPNQPVFTTNPPVLWAQESRLFLQEPSLGSPQDPAVLLGDHNGDVVSWHHSFSCLRTGEKTHRAPQSQP